MTGRDIRYALIHVFLFLTVCGCDRDTGQEKIEKTLSAVRTAAGSRDAGDILARISKSYHDPQGNDYEKIRSLLFYYFLRYHSITVVMTGLETEIQGGSANARFQAILSGRTGPSGNILPESLGAYRFTVLLGRESGEWVITSANWERIGNGVPE